MRVKRAEEIATVLSDSTRWHSHAADSRTTRGDDIKLKIDDLGQTRPCKAAFGIPPLPVGLHADE